MKPFYQDKFATIYHGDCRVILPTLPKVDLVLTDPPYGIGADKNLRANKQPGNAAAPSRDYGRGRWDKETPANELMIKILSAGKNAIVWGGNYFTFSAMPGWLVWDKENGSNGYADCELAWTNLPMAIRRIKHRWAGMLQENMAEKENRYHPTQKPAPLMVWCLSFAPDARSILDPFMGSGTTLVAAKQLGRQRIGIELEEKYCEIAAKRLQQEYLPLTVETVKPHEQEALKI